MSASKLSNFAHKADQRSRGEANGVLAYVLMQRTNTALEAAIVPARICVLVVRGDGY